MAELAELALTAGAEVVGSDVQHLSAPNPLTAYGKGKVEELKSLKGDLGFTTVVCNDELAPRQQRNLEDALDMKVLDRTEVILDIFARHARTHEGRLQVEAAQLRHLLPRLTGGRKLATRWWHRHPRSRRAEAGGRPAPHPAPHQRARPRYRQAAEVAQPPPPGPPARARCRWWRWSATPTPARAR